jgi:hypothetical protein
MSPISLKRWRGGMPRLTASLLVSAMAALGLLAATGTTGATGTIARATLGTRLAVQSATSSSVSWFPESTAVLPGTSSIWMSGVKYAGQSSVGTLWSSSGGSFTALKGLPASPNQGFGDVSALSSKNVWVEEQLSSGASAFLVFNGASWRTVPIALPTSLADVTIDSTLVLSADDIWATAYGACTDGSDGCGAILLLHFDGTTWSEPKVPGLGGATVVALAGSSPEDLWLLAGSCSPSTGTCTAPFALRFDGAWAKFAVPGSKLYDSGSELAVSSPTDVWLHDVSTVARFNGSHFVAQRGWAPADWNGASIAPFGTTSAWVVAKPLLRFNGASATSVGFALPGHSPSFELVAAASPKSAWAVGSSWTGQVCRSSLLDFAFHFDGAKWLRIGLPLGAWPLGAQVTRVTPEC